ncbi:hypothetical protein [Mesorhizobium sp. M0915]
MRRSLCGSAKQFPEGAKARSAEEKKQKGVIGQNGLLANSSISLA